VTVVQVAFMVERYVEENKCNNTLTGHGGSVCKDAQVVVK
jgi:hypothetical protein